MKGTPFGLSDKLAVAPHGNGVTICSPRGDLRFTFESVDFELPCGIGSNCREDEEYVATAIVRLHVIQSKPRPRRDQSKRERATD